MALDLEVTLEMLDYLGNSDGTGEKHSLGSQLPLDVSKYDGAVYYWEIVGSNSNASTDYAVSLCDGGNNVIASITLPHGGSSVYPVRLRTDALSLSSATYHIYYPQTSVTSQIYLKAARIVVVQTNATKTRIQIPLTHGGDTGFVDYKSPAAGVYGQGIPNYFGYFKKDSAEFSTLSGWTFEAVHKRYVAGKSYASLFDSSGNQIAESEFYTTPGSDSIEVHSVSLAGSEANFAEGASLQVKHMNDNGGGGSYLYRACLYAEISDLSKAHIYRRMAKNTSDTGSVSWAYKTSESMQKAPAANSAAYFEVTGFDTANSGQVGVGHVDTRDQVGAPITNVAAATISLSTTKSVVRSGQIALTADYRYIIGFLPGSGVTARANCAFLVIYCEVPSADSAKAIASKTDPSILIDLPISPVAAIAISKTENPQIKSAVIAHWHGGWFGIETPRLNKHFRFSQLVKHGAGFQVKHAFVDHETYKFSNPLWTDLEDVESAHLGVNRKAHLHQVWIQFPDADIEAEILQLADAHIPRSER